MPIDKATKLLENYKRNNFNAYKTLKDAGYSESTCKVASKRILNSAHNAVLKSKHNALIDDTSISTRDNVKNSLEILGITEEEVKNQLKNIALNDKDYTNALKVLTLLAKDINLNLTDDNQQSAPEVSITLSDNYNVKEAKEVN